MKSEHFHGSQKRTLPAITTPRGTFQKCGSSVTSLQTAHIQKKIDA